MQKEEWSNIILGIRKKLNLSQSELSKKIDLCRQAISRFEAKQRTPNNDSIKIILNFIKRKNLNIRELKEISKNFTDDYLRRKRFNKLDLKKSPELAELIGIILGDGEIRKDGTIRISFDSKKDKNFIYRRVFFLIKSLLNNKVGFESYKRISFGNIAFMRYLNEDCNLKSGNKFENNVGIPEWCFEREEYISSVLRGLFDTDGYFGYLRGSLEIMLGRFSCRNYILVRNISSAFNNLEIKHSIKQCKDKRYKIRITNQIDIIKFFKKIGTSNLKHIIRFLFWRINKYEAKIELEGLSNLIKKINKLIIIDIKDINLPFLWNLNNKYFCDYIKKDLGKVEGAKIRNFYKWAQITTDLINLIGNKNLAKKFNISERSVRKWREGTRNPSNKYILKLTSLLKYNNLKLSNYKVKINGKRNR